MKYEILKKVPLFSDMDEIKIEKTLGILKYGIHDYKKNCVVVSEKDEFRKLGIVMAGEISIQKIFPNGKAVILNRLKPGEMFGLSSFFDDQRCFPTNIITMEESRIMFIDHDNLIDILYSDKKLLINFIKFCTNRILFLNSRIEIFSIDGVEKRMAYHILSESRRIGSTDVVLKLSRKDWAEFLSVSRASLFRELHNLKEKKIISTNGKTIRILNPDLLKKCLS